MNLIDQQNIRDKTAALVTDWASTRQPPMTGETAEGFAEAITVAHLVADEARLGLHRWIDAARRTGLSWTDIGKALGISKQAAQQRFRPLDSDDASDVQDGDIIVRLGATAFNEMSILRDEGRKGHELIGTGFLKLVFRASETRWEYRREIGAIALAPELRNAGWEHVSSWLPFQYFKRPMAG